jgi:hypothetical protein
MTPALLLDTCSIINLSYCSPVATLFKEKYTGRAGWPHAVRTELTRQRAKRPPHPQAGRACNWAVTWLGEPIALTEPSEQIAVEAIQNEISLGSDNDALDHLGEAVGIYLLASAGTGRLISDESRSTGDRPQQQAQRACLIDRWRARRSPRSQRCRSCHGRHVPEHVASAAPHAGRIDGD